MYFFEVLPEKREKEKATMRNHGGMKFLAKKIEMKLNTRIFYGYRITIILLYKWCLHVFMIYTIYNQHFAKNVRFGVDYAMG